MKCKQSDEAEILALGVLGADSVIETLEALLAPLPRADLVAVEGWHQWLSQTT